MAFLCSVQKSEVETRFLKNIAENKRLQDPIFPSFVSIPPVSSDSFCVLEVAGVVFAKGGELGNWFYKSVADEPAVGCVDVDFPDGLSHAADAEEVLDEDNFNQGDGVNAGASHFEGGV